MFDKTSAASQAYQMHTNSFIFLWRWIYEPTSNIVSHINLFLKISIITEKSGWGVLQLLSDISGFGSKQVHERVFCLFQNKNSSIMWVSTVVVSLISLIVWKASKWNKVFLSPSYTWQSTSDGKMRRPVAGFERFYIRGHADGDGYSKIFMYEHLIAI